MPRLVHIDDGEIVSLDQQQFLNEKSLQDLLEKHPELVALDDVDPSARPMMTIGYEVPLAGKSLDLLYIDAAGRLVAVETKLRRNPEVRREVMGQILEYGAFLSSWTAQDVERQANDYFKSDRTEGDAPTLFQALDEIRDAEASEEPLEEEDLLHLIESHLESHDMRLVIAVDRIVDTLRQTVTFVNESSRFGIYLLEVQEYPLPNGAKVATLSTFGGTGHRAASNSTRGSWDETLFLETLAEQSSREDAAVIESLFKFIQAEADSVVWGTGTASGSAGFGVRSKGGRFSIFGVVTKGHAYIASGSLSKRAPEPIARALLENLQSLGADIEPNKALKEDLWLKVPAGLLAKQRDLEQFKDLVRSVQDAVS